MFNKNQINRGDSICFNGSGSLTVYQVTNKYLVVEIDQYTRKTVKLSAFRIVKINGKYHAYARLDSVLK
ncbi:hypothetical protein [Lactococcus lactis]|uniref:hypothetical protein n=1 Tax=Lactococcus lactis TaxID=1358 RepID=UPI001911D1DE|nr:hypothetical protein [Lactococcus lactis]WDA68332.1 hypothetical protein IL310_12500 [Lactococcus lactis]